MQPDFIQTDNGLIPRTSITGVDTSKLEKEGYILIEHAKGVSKASHIQAFEALMLLKPSALEGLRLKYGKGAWVLHNLVSHPLMQFVALGAMLVRRVAPKTASSMYDLAVSIHDSTVPKPQSGKLWGAEEPLKLHGLIGKKILITAGRPHEDIDGVRHYANHARSEGHGFAVASYLASQGAEVIIVTSKTRLLTPSNCKTVCTTGPNKKHISSGQDLMEVAQNIIVSGDFDAVLCLASISSIKAKEIAEQKIKAKKEPNASIALPVVGNVDIEGNAHRWHTPVMGYNSRQEFFATTNTPQWLENTVDKIRALEKIPYQAPDHEEPPQRPVPQLLQGKTVLMTSGPTVEQITTTGDVITNFSSGRQGRDIAYAFAQHGANVIYVTGPTNLPYPVHRHITVVPCSSACSMLAECQRHLPADFFVGVAAVADFGSSKPEVLKLSCGERHDFYLEQNPDILERIGNHQTQRPQLVIGFAAETDATNILEYAAGKLKKKNADLICANLVGSAIAQRDSSNNEITLVMPNNKMTKLDVMTKSDAALSIVRMIHTLHNSQNYLSIPLSMELS